MTNSVEISKISPREAYVHYCKIFRVNPQTEQMVSNQQFWDWLYQQGTPQGKPYHKSKPSKSDTIDRLTRLAPDFERRRRMFKVRLKTLLRIYLSKWFYRGLQFHEYELVRYLLDRLNLNFEFLSNIALSNTLGIVYFCKLIDQDSKESSSKQGLGLLELAEFTELLFNEENFKAIWNLKSVQGLRDFIFIPFQKEEHEGKLGIKKPRIRGYRDGKASPRDPTLIKQALELDVRFYSEQYEKKLASYYDDIDCYLRGLY